MNRISKMSLLFAMAIAVGLPGVGHSADKIVQPSYDEFFTDQALRVELNHFGTRGKESFGLEELVAEPVWPGTRVHLIDPTGYGKYRFTVFDKKSGQKIFSQGYCTLFGEWLTTPEAATGMVRSMSEPVRFPFPKVPVVLALEVRNEKTNRFKEIQRFNIDATAYDVRREQSYDFEVVPLHESGKHPSETLDIVIVPDGYTVREREKMKRDAQRMADVLFSFAPFDRYADRIAIRLVQAFSRESGPDEPRKGIFRDTVVDTTFDTFRSPRYLTTSNMKALRRVAALAPYDTIFVIVNSNRYGGGGIFGTYSIFTSDSEYDEYVMIHEFGHGFGALGDEYFNSSTGYDEDAFYTKGTEPWEPNITAQTKRNKIKWREFLSPGVAIPTPDTPENDGVIGLFEGAGYKSKGLYRPTRDSKMKSKGLVPFGPVNEAAIEQMIRYFTDTKVAQ